MDFMKLIQQIYVVNSQGTNFYEVGMKLNGSVIAEIKSPLIGSATISVKINNEFIIDADGVNDPATRTRVVNFVAEDVLPTRRRRSKASGKTAINTGTTSEREPGNR